MHAGGCGDRPTWIPGRSATTSTWPSARATCRSRRCSSRSPTRRSPTAAGSCIPTSASTSSPRTALSFRSCRRRLPQHPHQPGLPGRRSEQGSRDAASQPGGTSDDVFGNFPQQVYGKTGTAQYIERRRAGLLVVRVLRAQLLRRASRSSSSSGSSRAGSATSRRRPWRVRCSRSGSRQPRPVRGRELADAVNTTPIHDQRTAAAAGPRLQLAIDPLIMLAALGLVACSLVTLKGAAGTLLSSSIRRRTQASA